MMRNERTGVARFSAARLRLWPALLLLGTISVSAAIRSSSPQEIPLNVRVESDQMTVELDRGSTVHFAFGETTVSEVLLRVGDRQLRADMRTCALPRAIHTEDMVFIRDDLRQDEYQADGLTLLFDVGSESDRDFGKLPRVQLSWRRGEWVAALITHRVASNHGFSLPLCSPDVRSDER